MTKAKENIEDLTNNIKVPDNDIAVLKKQFGECFDKDGNFDLEKFKKRIEKNEVDFSRESYSLEWLGKSYARILVGDKQNTFKRR